MNEVSKQEVKIGELDSTTVYRKRNGEMYMKLNEIFHVKTKQGPETSWLGDGSAEVLDPDEVVEVIQF